MRLISKSLLVALAAIGCLSFGIQVQATPTSDTSLVADRDHHGGGRGWRGGDRDGRSWRHDYDRNWNSSNWYSWNRPSSYYYNDGWYYNYYNTYPYSYYNAYPYYYNSYYPYYYDSYYYNRPGVTFSWGF